MKTNRIISISFSLLLLLLVFSCKKEETKTNNSSNNNKIFPNNIASPTYPNGNATIFSTGNNGNTFAQGGGNTFSGGGNSSGIVDDDPSCLIGTWIEPQYLAPICPGYAFHLRLVFSAGGSGHATHLDEYLCTPNMELDFTWDLKDGNLFLEFENGCKSNTPFSCPATSLTIMWQTNNPKTLQRG